MTQLVLSGAGSGRVPETSSTHPREGAGAGKHPLPQGQGLDPLDPGHAHTSAQQGLQTIGMILGLTVETFAQKFTIRKI